MKPSFISLILLFCLLPLFASGPVKSQAFKPGEELRFRAYYHSWVGNMTAGYATLKVNPVVQKVNGKPSFHVKAEGASTKGFNWFFEVYERFETWIHQESMLPLKYSRRTREGKFRKDEDYVFDHQKKVVTSTRARTSITPSTHDIISALFYTRSLDFSKARKGQIFPIEFIYDDELSTSWVRFEGRDTIDLKMGRFACLKFKPKVLQGNVFDEDYPMTVWVTDDANKLPLLAESEVIVGSVRLELISYANLAHPLRSSLKGKPAKTGSR
ncbi:MAG TPA: DUF3108 domain-containing protein [Bacteroidales bacterium]|nr:DUF3108 domain-containing protein [Bacteroidales bacterium]